MNITIADLRKMTEKQVFEVAVKMRAQCRDKKKLEAKLGDADDLVQMLAIALFQFKSGSVELRSGATLTEACFGIVRTAGRSNWMSDRASAYQRDGDIEDDSVYECAEEDEPMYVADGETNIEGELEGWEGHTLDDVEGLSAMDRLLIQHDTLASGARQGMTKDLAEMFGCDERTIRLRRSSLRRDLTRKLNLPADFFSKKVEHKVNLDKKEYAILKYPLSNFVPMPANSNSFSTIGIR